MRTRSPLLLTKSLSFLLLLAGFSHGEVSFNYDIKPILSNTCYRCHGPDEAERKAKLRLDTFEGATADLKGTRAIVPGDLSTSELIYRITTDDPDEVMPPPKAGKRLPKDQVDLFKQWIKEGANYDKHWSYKVPKRPEVPAISGEARSGIDAFIQHRLTQEGLSPAKAADKFALIRRVTMDLTGLPPTPEDVELFVNDPNPMAYENLVDRLLAAPTFGEHWARMWLDLARYADSAGYADDPPRTIWGYRDYVISAFNQNKPFHEFTTEQIAGDLLKNPTEEQLVATGFHRNTQTNNEGGTSDEEFRNVAVVDRVNTTMQTWMGTTMACAQCHTHKYDPITHEEYFRMFAIFNNTEDADRRNESPTISLLSPLQKRKKAALQREIEELEANLKKETPGIRDRLVGWEKKLKINQPVWSPLTPSELKAQSGASLDVLDDGSILASGKQADTEIYTLIAKPEIESISGVRLEVLPHDSLGSNGPGRSGNFVLNEFNVVAGGNSKSKRGKFVRLELPGKGKFLHVAEVQVFDGGTNIARKGKASQSTTGFDGPAQKAIDGNTNGDHSKGSVTHTAAGDPSPWWEVDLGETRDISKIVVWNRTDGETTARLDGFKLQLLDEGRNKVWEKQFTKAPKQDVASVLSGGTPVPLQNPSASFEQQDFTVAESLESKDGNSGWAIGPRTGTPHIATYQLAKPISNDKALKFSLRQIYAKHAIGRFRLSVTDHQQPVWTLPSEIQSILAISGEKRRPEQVEKLISYYSDYDPGVIELKTRLASLKKQIGAIKPSTTVPVFRELPKDKQRKTHIQLRGNYLDKGAEVTVGLPEALSESHPDSPDRLALAKWLVDENNPLTARVIANRFWGKNLRHWNRNNQ